MNIGAAFTLIRNGASIKQTDSAGGIPITRIETIANRVIDRNHMGYADIYNGDKYSSYFLRDGDILMSHINSIQHLGKAAIYHPLDEKEKIIHGMNLLVLRANQKILDNQFAYFYFSSDSFLHKLPRITKKSVNQASFTVSELKKIDIPCPALSQQHKIAKILSIIQTLCNKRNEQLKIFDELVKSRFLEMFGDIELNSQKMQKMMWQEVFDTQTGKLDANAAVKGGRYPFFTCAKEISTIDEYAYDCEALLLAGNNAVGDYDVKYYKGKFNAYQRTYILILKNRQYSYSVFKFQLEQKLRYLQLQSKGTNTRYLTMGILRSLDFIVPPIVKQQEFAQFVNATDKSKMAVQKSLDELEILKKSLMQTYFG
ncbi:restriction endonuclease subunit S [uncultured Dialister sp.]|uniref:restriction endonuclease subunit S n=2 Tax=uncultured Dialister sp. TaxID=278064 RepID=UPI00258D9E82|nr:restriction endonuclease subunit S [uncultured Dialister sp.]